MLEFSLSNLKIEEVMLLSFGIIVFLFFAVAQILLPFMVIKIAEETAKMRKLLEEFKANQANPSERGTRS